MSQSFTIDPDIPQQSIEHHGSAATNNFTTFRDTPRSPRLPSSSPNRTPFKTPLSHPETPATDLSSGSPSLIRNERRSTPNLQSKRPSSSLSVSRGQTPSRIQLRRVSSNLNPASPTANMKQSDQSPPPSMTPESVAREYFRRELREHTEDCSKTIVIVHDSCYGHRFSRPKTSKTALSTIVERPERILATLLGASTAYVQLGQRHAGGAYGPNPDTDIKLAPRPFTLRKTSRYVPLTHPAVTRVHGTKWMEELQIMCDSAESKLAMNGKELQRPIGYGKDENGNNLPKLHEGDLYLCSESLAALEGCLGGVCDAVDIIFSPSETTRAFVCIRPPGHHCSSNFPSGFCWLNNVHVGVSYAATNHGLTHAAIIDFDLHHGDGSQTVAWDHNKAAQSLPKNAAQHKKTPIGYYSLHDINSYPCEWGDEEKVRNASLCIENAHGQSIWNVHLEPWTSLEHFWQLYESKYVALLDKARLFLQHHSSRLRSAGVTPKAAIFLSAGFDASQWEGQGMQRHNVNVPTEFYARFTSDVVKLAAVPETGVDGRVVSVLEGGYSDRALMSGVMSHLCGLSEDAPYSGHLANPSNNVGLGLVNGDNIVSALSSHQSQWWSEENLSMLEDRVAGNVPPPPKKQDKVPGNFSSPTQASTARMTDVARERSSVSAQLEARLRLATADPGPPPPVDWVTASYELSRVLIPNDRQTLSCRHDELNAEATKVRRERQSMVGVSVPEPRMQLRTRTKGVVGDPEGVRTSSRTSNRRTTIAAVSELSDPPVPAQRSRRRSSAASSILSSFQDMKIESDLHTTEQNLNNTAQGSSFNEGQEGAARKSKMLPPTRKVVARASSPRKLKANVPQPSKPTSLQTKLATIGKSPTPGSASPPHSAQGPNSNNVNRDPMDDLTHGFKKVSIKLNMPTPEQHAENQRRLEEARNKKPRVTRKAPVPKVAKPKTISTSDPAQPASVPQQTEQGVMLNGLSQSASNANSVDAPIPVAELPNSDKAEPIPHWQNGMSGSQGPDAIQHSVIPYPQQLETSNGSTNIDKVTAIASTTSPNNLNGTDTNATKHRANLPVFTSSSPIPFAQPITPTTTEQAKNKQIPSV